MARAGFYPDELQDVEGGDLEEAAKNFADDHHEITEECDTNFEVYVEADDGTLHQFNMKTDWDPIYFIDSSEVVKST